MQAKSVVIVLLGLLSSSALVAEMPVYHDGLLLLDEVVTLRGDKPRYYRNVELETAPNGNLQIVQFFSRSLAVVDEIDVTVFQSEGLQASVHASGLLSIACVALEAPAVSREGSVFTVVLAETVMPQGSVCMPIVAETPFDVLIPLPLAGLAAGEYQVRVNNLVTSFVIP